MKTSLILIAGLALSAASQAQTPVVIIEACNSLADADKRLECLKAAMGSSSITPKVALIDTLARAFGAMQAGIDIGISYRDYQTSLLELARAIAAFKQQAPDLPTTAIDEALTAYNDAGWLWQSSIQFYAGRDNNIMYSNGIPVPQNNLFWLVSRYGLATGKTGFLGLEIGLDATYARGKIWSIAKSKAEQGLGTARNPPPPAPPPKEEPDIDLAYSTSYAKSQGCDDATTEKIGEAGLAYHYKASCKDGSTMKVSCVFGNCRTLP